MRLAGKGSEREQREGGRASADHEPADADERLPRTHRLRRRQDFLRIQQGGTRVHTRHYVVIVVARADGPGPRRLGVTVTRKVAGAVGRNRVKRVLREVFRRNRQLFPEGCDVVVIAKSGAPDLGYEEARAELARVRGPMASAAKRASRSNPAGGSDGAR